MARKPNKFQPKPIEADKIANVAEPAPTSTSVPSSEPIAQELPPIKQTPENTMNFEDNYFTKLHEGGFDATMKGGWQKMFAHFMDQLFGLKDKKVLDIGCAMGAQTSAFADYNIKAYGVDISNYAINKGKSLFKNVELICAPAWDLSAIPDNSVDIIFSMYTLNHIPEDKCQEMFKEINRVSKNGAIFFSILHLGSTKKRNAYNDVIYPKYFWDEIANKFGMLDGTRQNYAKMMGMRIPGWDFMRQYNWHYLLYKVQKEG